MPKPLNSRLTLNDYLMIKSALHFRRLLFAFFLSFCSLSASAQYCNSSFTNVTFEHITNVTFAGINNTSSGDAGAPVNYIGQTAVLTEGVSENISVTIQVDGNEYIYAFIDWNQNQVLDDAGEVYTVASNVGTAGPHILSITPPTGALTGITRMRVMVDWNNASPNPCRNATYGEAEDYSVLLMPNTPCSGPPVAGTATAPASVCANSPFSIVTSGYSLGTGLSFQWEESPAGANMWSNVAGGTGPNLSVSGITAAMDYRLIVTCTNGGLTDMSNVVTVNLSGFINCYCYSGAANPFDGEISNVVIGALNNSSTCAASNQMYTDFTATVPALPLMQSQTVPVAITAASCGGSYNAYVKIFIDLDQDGTFTGPGEEVFSAAPPGGQYTPSGVDATGTITIPVTATIGQTRMRVILQQTTVAGDVQPCGMYNYGETEDYLVDITAAVACSGPPTAGTASAPSDVCANTPFNLGVTGYTLGTGIEIQWEESPSGANIWTPIPTANAPVATIAAGITAATDYRAIITCTNGGLTDITNTVTVNLSPFYSCYCAATNMGGSQINNITIQGTTFSHNTGTGPAPTYYTAYPDTGSATTSLMQGLNYTVDLTFDATAIGSIWIDYNQDGIFDATEWVQTGLSGTSHTATIAVPAGALTGLTGMRVRSRGAGNPNGAGDACLAMGGGETEDYLITIAPAIACSNQPTAGTASAPAGICAGTDFNLTVQGTTGATGITYQWEESPAGANMWTAIASATTPIYTVTGGITAPMDYRVIVTCTNGGLTDMSNVVSVALNPFYSCYCPVTNAGTAQITNVTVTGTTMNHNSGASSAPGFYTSYPDTGSATAVLVQGVVYPVSLTFDGSAIGSIWIDYNQDGIFDATEWVQTGLSGTSHSASITVPLTALTGQTGMRVRSRGSGNPNGAGDACIAMGGGETHDYIITIDAAPACAGTPVAGTASGPANACTGVPFTLSVTGYSIGTGISFQWEESPAGANTWNPIASATGPIHVVNSQTASTDYRVVITCSNSSMSDNSNIVTVTQNLPTQCYCASNFTDVGWEHITNVTYAGINNSTAGVVGGPVDFTTQVGNVSPGVADVISVSILADQLEYIYAFIDWDQNGVLNDAGEVYVIASSVSSSGPHTLSITPPVTAASGNTRMRVMLDYNNSNPDPCRNADFGEAEDYTLNVGAPPACLPPSGLQAISHAVDSVAFSWTAVSGAVGYEYVVDQNSSSPAGAGTPVTSTNMIEGNLSTPNTYYIHVRTDCGSGFSSWATTSVVMEDDAPGAIPLTLGAGCTGNIYDNSNASHSATEPYADCNAYSMGHHSQWFSFVAPASGAVRVSTDILPAGTHQDTKVGIFSATDVNDYSTFTIISCDEDGGTDIDYNSIAYATGLTSGQTYYVQVDGWSSADYGTFCITVDELNSSMLSSGSASCDFFETPVAGNTSYTGWVPLLDSDGLLVAMVRNPAGGAGADYSGSFTVNTSGIRTSNGINYLDRNYHISNSMVAAPVDVQVFFLDAEFAALNAADGGSNTLGGLNVTRQTGTSCEADYLASAGTNSLLMQTGNGSANGVSWVAFTTPGFSNFYLAHSLHPLAIRLLSFTATNAGERNHIVWSTSEEAAGDYFELERSADGQRFEKLTLLQANGAASTYSFWDESPFVGVNYYRLKLVSRDGAFSYSEVVRVTVAGNGNISVYPNPTVDQLYVSVKEISGTAAVLVTDARGQVIRRMDMKEGLLKIPMKELAAGIYFIQYQDDLRTESFRINKL